MTWLAAALTTAAWLVARPSPWMVLWLRGRAPLRLPGGGRWLWPVGGSVAMLVGWAGLPVPQLLLLATAIAIVLFVLRQWWRDRRRAAAATAAAETAEIVDVIAASLRAGIAPDLALARAAGEFAILQPVLTASVYGQDVPAALRSVAAGPGRTLLADLAAGWAVAARTGAPLADVLGRVGDAVRAEAEARRHVQTAAAPARATGRVMAFLPLLGLGLGHLAGADPITTIWTSPAAAGCVAVGVGVSIAGVSWVDRLVCAVEGD